MLWAAADVLRLRPPNATEIDALVPVALERSRPAGQRLRALSLLRPSRWVHLATLLEVQRELPMLSAAQQDAIDWVLRTD